MLILYKAGDTPQFLLGVKVIVIKIILNIKVMLK